MCILPNFCRSRLRFILPAVGIFLSFYSIGGCALKPDREVLYSVAFDTRSDDQHARVLDYKYMRDSVTLMAPIAEDVEDGQGMVASNKSLWMQRGTSLYVKWTDENTGAVHEDTADLRGKLPLDMTDKDIRFTVKGSQLAVYVLFSKEPPDRSKSERPNFATSVRFTKIYPQ